MNVRAIVAWTLYDFANSSFAAVVFATIYAAYYAIGVVGNDRGLGDLWWGRVISVSMAAVALSSPFLGGLADRAGIRRPLFIGFTALSVTATALLATVQPGMINWGFVLGVLGNFGYERAAAPLAGARRRSRARPGAISCLVTGFHTRFRAGSFYMDIPT